MPFTQSQKTKSHEPLQRTCSSPVGASAGKKKKRASAPTIAQIVVIIFDFIMLFDFDYGSKGKHNSYISK